MAAAAEVMDNPADLINVAIEELVRQRIELPAFSTLDRLSRRIRTLVNGRFFTTVMERLSDAECGQLDALLEVGSSPQKKSLFFAPQTTAQAFLFGTLAGPAGPYHQSLRNRRC